jgi:hypothetical protein
MDGWLVGGLVREREYGAGSLLVRGYRERSCIYNSNSISRAIYNFVNIFTLMKIFQHGPIDGTNSPLPFRHLPKMHQPKLPNLLPNPHRPSIHLLHNRHA